MDLGDWLRRSGLERYHPALVDNAIDLDILPDLTEADLEQLGLPLGDRKRLLRAAREIRTTPPGHAAAPSGDDPTEAAERRHLTVMICDLVNSTALSNRLDPEDLRAVIDAYHATCSRICLRYDGYITEFRGDGIMAYFGYPRAHEDDAERTVRAALEIVGALARLDLPFAGPLTVRIGIATGLVVVGEPGSGGALGERSVFGDTPSLAARLQTLAEPGHIVVGASTGRLLGALFRVRSLGSHSLKGFAEPVPAWMVDGVATSVSRFASIRAAALTEFVGRAEEIAFLLERQRRAWKGEGQVVLITGEPGIGKSRLAAAVAERIEKASYTPIVLQCSPYRTSSALHPLITHLERAAGLKEDDTPLQRLEKLEQLVVTATRTPETIVPLLAGLLSIPLDGRYPQPALSPTAQRRQTLAAMVDLMAGLARDKPVLLLFEDAHWADATSLELLGQAVARVADLRVLALVTTRPGAELPLMEAPNVSTLALAGLEGREIESMATRVTGGRVLPADVMQRIVAKTDGNPLFVEELTKTVVESAVLVEDGDGFRLDQGLPELAIPATLRDSLMARLDRSAPMKRIAQIGAAIGRDFTFSLLRAVVSDAEQALLDSLAQLEQAGLVFRRGDPAEGRYSFKHALIRDAAYESLLRSRRSVLHRQIARALEQSFPAIAESEPEIVAHHLLEANLVDPGIDYLLKAGIRALGRSANAEAVEHLGRGVSLLQSLPPSPERARKELDFQLSLGPALAATEGYATPRTLAAFSRSRELLGESGTLTEQMTVLWGTYLAHNMRAEHTRSLEVARQCLALAEQHEHPGIAALANRFIGQTLNIMGALGQARVHLERAIALCTAHEEAVASYRNFGIDDQVGAMFNLARTLLLQGYPDQSAAEAERSIARAETLSLPFTIALALGQAAMIGVLARDTVRLGALADRAIAYSAHHRLLEPEYKARFMKGAVLAQTGDPAGGLEIMRQAMAAERQAVSGENAQYRGLYLGLMAEAHLSLGEVDVGLDLVQDAIADVEAREEKFIYAELFRIRASLLLAHGARADAEASLERALAIAREQGARWWELRAATDLAALWREEGAAAQARSVLQPVSAWFSEGFDRAVLRHANALLRTLEETADHHDTVPTSAGAA